MAGLQLGWERRFPVKWRQNCAGATVIADNLSGRGNTSSIMPANVPSIMARKGRAATGD